MTLGIELADVRLRYGKVEALRGLSLRLAGGRICGLLGRSGSGKTSLVSLLAAYRRPSSGRVTVGGTDPFDDRRTAAGTCLIRETGDLYGDDRLRTAVKLAGRLRPTFDPDFAARLLDSFGLSPERRVGTLSRGQRSAFGVVLGLASRAPLTIFDEVHLGMDAPSRYAFYDAMIADYAEHPRTIIVSTHLIGEISRLLEEVVIIDSGRLVAYEEAEVLRERGVTVTGPAAEVAAFTEACGLAVLSEQRLGGTASATLFGALTAAARGEAAAAGLDLGPVGLQDLFVHLTAEGVRQ